MDPRSTRVCCTGWGGGESNGFKHISGLIFLKMRVDEEKQSLYILLIKEILLTHQFNREVGSLSHYSKGFCPSRHGNSDCDASLWNTSIWLYKSSYLYKLPHICTLENTIRMSKWRFLPANTLRCIFETQQCAPKWVSLPLPLFPRVRHRKARWTVVNIKNSTHLSNKHVQSTKKQQTFHKRYVTKMCELLQAASLRP